MKNVILVASFAWLLFFGGFSTIKNILSNPAVTSSTNTIANGVTLLSQTPIPTKIVAPTAKVYQPAVGAQIVPIRMPVLPTATPEPVAASVVVWCEEATAGQACTWRDREKAIADQQRTEQESLDVWTNMAEQAVNNDAYADPLTPTAEVPTECQNPQGARAKASCELIKRGIIHPKG